MPITQRATATVALATRTNTTVTPPAGTTTGDLLVVDIAVGGTGAAATITPPAGWTQVATLAYGDASDNYYLRMSRFVKAWASGETSYVFTHVSKSSQAYTRALVGANTSSPGDGTPFTLNQDNNGASSIAGSMTTATNGAWVLVFRGSWDGNAITPPSGYTESLDTPVIWEGYQEKATAGATGTITVPAGNGGLAPSGLIISAIKPSTGTVPVGGFAAGYGFGPAAASGDRASEGGVAAAYAFGSATASGEVVTRGAFTGAYGFGEATAQGETAARAGFAGSYTFGPAAAAGESPSEGGFATSGYAFGPATAEGLLPAEGGFNDSDYTFGPATAGGEPVGSVGGFEGAYAFGPAVADGLAQQGGGFEGGYAFGPADSDGTMPAAGDFSGTYTFGPGATEGAVEHGGGFAGTYRFGLALGRGRAVGGGRFSGTTYAFGPGVTEGHYESSGGFEGTTTMGPASASGPLGPGLPDNLGLATEAPELTLTGKATRRLALRGWTE